jgi:hypothetical protein
MFSVSNLLEKITSITIFIVLFFMVTGLGGIILLTLL